MVTGLYLAPTAAMAYYLKVLITPLIIIAMAPQIWKMGGPLLSVALTLMVRVQPSSLPKQRISAPLRNW